MHLINQSLAEEFLGQSITRLVRVCEHIVMTRYHCHIVTDEEVAVTEVGIHSYLVINDVH